MAKSELILAFNEIAEQRKLPREVIIEALKAALVSAYRRNAGISSAQYVEARVDERTGEPSVWVEREVVEEVQSPQTEVSLEVARTYNPNAQIGDMVLVNDTPEDFGRIAAQTAKQVILQRMREAEREVQFQEYQDRVGDLVTGTVQSDSGDVVAIGLGRTEAILPRSQQVPGETYRMHDKVRAYVMEVRRLLEYEVPEIYNGTVEIKSIAREPGARSKVAVAALQPGADPVGACVGMRGVRIQSIVRELNNEKIDVIEWSPDDAVFIAKALSPARVSAVFLDDDPDAGRTATVIVPDDQLSLAIGREGQNARLAAKLTGWRIDIKSVSEAAQETYEMVLADPALSGLLAERASMVERIGVIMEKRAASKPIMPEDYQLMLDFVKLVENYRAGEREELRAEQRARLEAVRQMIPRRAYEHALEDTDLPLRVYELLADAGYNTVGDVMEQYYFNKQRLLDIPGFGQAALEAVESKVLSLTFEEPEAPVAAEAEPEPESIAPAAEPVAELTTEGADWQPPAEAEVLDAAEEEARLRRAELVARMGAAAAARFLQAEEEAAALAAQATPETPTQEKTTPAREPAKAADLEFEEEDLFEYDDMTAEEREELARKRARQRRRQLIFDENAGRVVAKRRRKGGRKREDWLEDWEEE